MTYLKSCACLALTGLLLLIALPIHAQQLAPPCGTDVLLNRPDPIQGPERAIRKRLDAQVADLIARGANLRTNSTYTIPVVVHLIHQNGTENISNAQVLLGIQHLNDAFANTGPYQSAQGVNTDIQFCLAEQDPQGNATSGINRLVSPLTQLTLETQDANLKALSFWDSERYLNVWLVAEITSMSMGSGVAGYATFPSSHGSPSDGIVEEARWFGGTVDDDKVTAHEVGHYLGLYHTFEGSCTNNNCLTDGDHVCDTPPDGSSSPVSCPATANTCNSDDDDLSSNNPFRPINQGGQGDQPDPSENYMDYGYQSCQTEFSTGQKDRMISFLTTTRASLLGSTGCNTPCPVPVTAAFIPSASPATFGTPVTFTNQSTGATTYQWSVDGTPISTQTNLTHNFTTTGMHTISLTASGSQPGCADSISIYLLVECAMQASLISSDDEVQPGETVTFTQQTPGSQSYTWLIDGVQAGTGNTFSHTFQGLGGQNVCLVTFNGQCRDTACTYVSVGDCGRKRNNVWTFGFHGHGLDFNSGVGVHTPSSIYGNLEGNSSICDQNGNLIMYTDGDKVYRATGQSAYGVQMPNGDSLWGGYLYSSSTHAAMIIPKPLDDSTFYIFTVDEAGGFIGNTYGGLAYSIVDLRLPGTFTAYPGDVAQKNIPLYTPSAEKLAAVRHANGCDIWVLSHAFQYDSLDYVAYRVTPNGVDPVPVRSSIGFPHCKGFLQMGSPATVNAQGQMKISPDGTKIAVVIQDTLIMEVLGFDKSTGQVTNSIFRYQASGTTGIYGLEFSPDGSKLYLGQAFGSARIIQFNLNAPTPAAMLASATVVHTAGNSSLTSMQLGPDGKIYVAMFNENRIAAITNPNALGAACNVDPYHITTSSVVSMGFQTTLTDYALKTPPQAHGPIQVCRGSIENYYFDQFSCSDTVLWTIETGVQRVSQTGGSTLLYFPQVGTYTLIAEAFTACGHEIDTLEVTVVPFQAPSLGPDRTLCGGPTLLNPSSGYQSYQWSTGATSSTLNVSQAGTYRVTVTAANGCQGSDTIIVHPQGPAPNISLGPDTTICNGTVVTLNPGAGFASYRWQDLSTNPTFTAWLPGTYWVEVTNACGQTDRDTVIITGTQFFNISLGTDTVICEGSTIPLTPGSGYATYLWQNGSTNPSFNVTLPGTYWVQVTDLNGCQARDSIFIDVCVGMIGDGLQPLQAQVYPVPTTGLLYVQFNEGIQTTLTITILDQLGREVAQHHHTGSGQQTFPIDLQRLSQGVYHLRIHADGQNFSARVVKQ